MNRGRYCSCSCDKPSLSKDLGKLADLEFGRHTRSEKIVRSHAAVELQQIVFVFHPVADRDAVVVEGTSVQELHMKLERLVSRLNIQIRTFRKLRGSGRLVLLDRLAVGFVACTEVEAHVQPLWGMKHLVKVSLGLRDADSGIVREDNLL